MPFVIAGGLLVALKLLGIDPVAGWPWWGVAAPLVVALLWWRYADASGLNKRREIARLEERKAERRRNALQTLGVGPEAEKEKREAEKARAARQRQIDSVEGKRAAKRAKARNSVLGSRFDSELMTTRFQESRR
jgi:small Trp-rich protein